jgi:hypothetical protein
MEASQHKWLQIEWRRLSPYDRAGPRSTGHASRATTRAGTQPTATTAPCKFKLATAYSAGFNGPHLTSYLRAGGAMAERRWP